MENLSGDDLLIGNLKRFFARSGPDENKPALESLLETRGPGAPWRVVFRNPEHYVVAPALDRAAYVSLLLGQPLLLTGEPGAGKSDFARKLAHLFDLGVVQEVHVKTTTLGRDLLYGFDDVARFRDAIVKVLPRQQEQSGGHPSSARAQGTRDPSYDPSSSSPRPKPLCRYVQFHGLGRAILRAAGPGYRVTPVGRDLGEIYDGSPNEDGSINLVDLFPTEFGAAEGQDVSERVTRQVRTVVLIDEIDKAQRDTPNDLLDTIDRMRFDIPELSITIEAPPDYWPIVIITSNAERTLPAPFLRRCVFLRLVTPEDRETLTKILAGRMTEDFSRGKMAADALNIYLNMRKQSQRPPGLAELLAWCLLLQRLGFDHAAPLARYGKDAELLETSLSALAKTETDFEAAKRVLSQWREGTVQGSVGAGS